MSEYPEHEKLKAVADESQTIGAFLDWLDHQGLTICSPDHKSEYYWPAGGSIQDRLAEYFEIDQVKLESEKRAMLDELRASHAARGE